GDHDDDLYEDFNYSIPSQMQPGTSSAVPGTANFRQTPQSSYRGLGTSAGRPLPSQLGRMMTG
ncbi:unnamed protein product, partial [Chrysoparadoxa australica]